MRKILKTVLLLILFATFPSISWAQVLDKACVENLANEDLYERNKMSSYTFLAPGENGWLLRTKTDFVQDFTPNTDTIKWMKRTQDAFAQKGITLIIVYTPTRGLVAGEYVPDSMRKKHGFDLAKARQNYSELISSMQKQGLHFVGVTNYQKGEGFFRKRDQHWNANGARQTAETVATYIKTLPVYKTLTHQNFKTDQLDDYKFEGRFNEVLKKFCNIKMESETGTNFQTTVVHENQNEEDLFGSVAPPEIVLIGTSNSKADSFNVNFDGFLKEYLSADIKNNAISGIGIDDPFYAYLASEDFTKNPPKLIIWEIPGYYVLGKHRVNMFQQLEAGVKGSCRDNSLLASGQVTLDKRETKFFENIEDKTIVADPNYIYLEFDEPVKKKFSYNITYADEKKSTKRFEFDRSASNSNDSKFYGIMHTYQASVQKIDIKISKKDLGRTVEAFICNGAR